MVIRTFFSDKILSQKMMPYLDPTLYEDKTNQQVVSIVNKFIRKHHRSPEAQELVLCLDNTGFADEARNRIMELCNAKIATPKQDFLVQMLEKFYQEKASTNILKQSAVHIFENNIEAVRDLLPALRNKLNFSLHMSLGLDLVDDIDEAKRRLKEISKPIPSGITDINVFTAQRKDDPTTGGYPKKTLCLYVGQPNVGKTLVLCSESCYLLELFLRNHIRSLSYQYIFCNFCC